MSSPCETSNASNCLGQSARTGVIVQVQEIQEVLARRPFNPLRLHKSDGKTVKIPFSHVAIVFGKRGLLVFKGVKREGSHVAKSFEIIPYEQIEWIEQQRGGANGRRKKAS